MSSLYSWFFLLIKPMTVEESTRNRLASQKQCQSICPDIFVTNSSVSWLAVLAGVPKWRLYELFGWKVTWSDYPVILIWVRNILKGWMVISEKIQWLIDCWCCNVGNDALLSYLHYPTRCRKTMSYKYKPRRTRRVRKTSIRKTEEIYSKNMRKYNHRSVYKLRWKTLYFKYNFPTAYLQSDPVIYGI